MKNTLARIHRNIEKFRPMTATEAVKIAEGTTGAENLIIEAKPIEYRGFLQGVRLNVNIDRRNAKIHYLPSDYEVYSIFDI